MPLTVSSPQTIGLDGGDYCIICSARGFRAISARDDDGSLTFDSPDLVTAMDIVGAPELELEFAVDKPVAFIALRLNDIRPTGESRASPIGSTISAIATATNSRNRSSRASATR